MLSKYSSNIQKVTASLFLLNLLKTGFPNISFYRSLSVTDDKMFFYKEGVSKMMF